MKQSIFKYFLFILFVFFADTVVANPSSYYEKFELSTTFYREGRYRLAEEYFSSILSDDRDYRDPAAQLMLAKSRYRQGKLNEAEKSGKFFISSYPESKYEFHAKMLLGDIALSKSQYTRAFEIYLSIVLLSEDSKSRMELDQRILACIGFGLKEDRLESILFLETSSEKRAILNFSRAYVAWQNGDKFDLEMALEGINTGSLSTAYHSQYQTLKNMLDKNLSPKNTIAILLPLSGLEQDKGQSYLMGLGDFFQNQPAGNSSRFLVYDTGGNNIEAIRFVKSILNNHSIIAVLGPLLDEELISVSGISSTLPILVPKSNPVGLSDIASNLFFLSPSNKTIAERIAQMMVKELEVINIAVLSPGDIESKSMTDCFIDELFQFGIDPVAVEWYYEKPENISKQFKAIRKTAWSLLPEMGSRADALEMTINSLDSLFDVNIDDFFEIPDEDEKMNKRDSSKVVLETIHAIYLPIREDELTFVGTQFPVYNLKTILFGNENWLKMDVLNQEIIGPHVQGMQIISDVNSPVTNNEENTFINYYSLAQDHGHFLNSTLSGQEMTRRRYIEKLRSHSGFYGEYTAIQFLGQNKNENNSTQVLEYSGKSLKKLGTYDGNSLIKSH